MKLIQISTQSLLCLLLFSACAIKHQPPPDPNASLYERLGKLPAIELVVKDLVVNISQDKRINGFFIGADIPHTTQMLIDQVCAVTGGPCEYKGRDMVSVHQGMNITDAQFDALLEDLEKSLNKYGVGESEKKELLSIMQSLRGTMVDTKEEELNNP